MPSCTFQAAPAWAVGRLGLLCSQRNQARSEMMRVGIVGTGFGESRCKMVQAVPEAKLVAICGRDAARTGAVAERYGCEAVIDYRQLIERPDIDVVGVYTSTDLHGEISIAA